MDESNRGDGFVYSFSLLSSGAYDFRDGLFEQNSTLECLTAINNATLLVHFLGVTCILRILSLEIVRVNDSCATFIAQND